MILTREPSTLKRIESVMQDGDVILLASDGCYQARRLPAAWNTQALAADMKTRGLNEPFKNIALLNDDEWVALITIHGQVASWT
jgi:sulfur relay protein TusB/DsrH